jgi:hypothetical protein
MIIGAGLLFGIFINTVEADALKNSLSNMIHEKETMPAMVDLNRLDKPVAQVKKTRSPKSIIAIVNGHKIRKEEADNYLKERTEGKVTDVDQLPKEQRKRLIQELSLPMLIADAAKKELSSEEKEGIYVSMWIAKKAKKISVTDDELKAFYDQLKQRAEAQGSNSVIPPFESIKHKIKSQLTEKKIMDGLMTDVKIEVAAPRALPPMRIKP